MYVLYLTLCAYDDHANPLARIDRNDGVVREGRIARVGRLDEVPEIAVLAQVSKPSGRVLVEEIRELRLSGAKGPENQSMHSATPALIASNY
jgi:hypothetical protein